jgi:hypothetical protein
VARPHNRASASVGALWRTSAARHKTRPDKSLARWASALFGPNFRLLLTSGLGLFAAFHMAELRFARLF